MILCDIRYNSVSKTFIILEGSKKGPIFIPPQKTKGDLQNEIVISLLFLALNIMRYRETLSSTTEVPRSNFHFFFNMKKEKKEKVNFFSVFTVDEIFPK